MGALSGTAGSVIYFNGSDTVVGEVREWTLDLGNTALEVTAFGDVASRFVTNIKKATGSFAGHVDVASAVQGSVRDDFLTGSRVRLLMYSDGTAYVDAIEAYVTGMSPMIAVDGAVAQSWDFQVSRVLDTSTGLERLLLEDDDKLLMEDGSGVRTDVVDGW